MEDFELTDEQKEVFNAVSTYIYGYHTQLCDGTEFYDGVMKVISLLTDDQIKQLANERDMLVIHESDL